MNRITQFSADSSNPQFNTCHGCGDPCDAGLCGECAYRAAKIKQAADGGCCAGCKQELAAAADPAEAHLDGASIALYQNDLLDAVNELEAAMRIIVKRLRGEAGR